MELVFHTLHIEALCLGDIPNRTEFSKEVEEFLGCDVVATASKYFLHYLRSQIYIFRRIRAHLKFFTNKALGIEVSTRSLSTHRGSPHTD